MRAPAFSPRVNKIELQMNMCVYIVLIVWCWWVVPFIFNEKEKEEYLLVFNYYNAKTARSISAKTPESRFSFFFVYMQSFFISADSRIGIGSLPKRVKKNYC